MTNGTLRWELHDVLANDDHAVGLHITRAERNGRSLAERVRVPRARRADP
jgi:hypothetical protein